MLNAADTTFFKVFFATPQNEGCKVFAPIKIDDSHTYHRPFLQIEYYYQCLPVKIDFLYRRISTADLIGYTNYIAQP